MQKKPDFTLIPFLEIEDNAREIAVSWVENYTPYGATLPEIAQKQKLASDIINYAKWRVELETKSLQSQLSSCIHAVDLLEKHGFIVLAKDDYEKSQSQNERLLSALKEFVHVRYIDQELIDRAKQLINEIEKPLLINDSGER